MKRIALLVLGLSLGMQGAPVLAYQPHNWPGMSSNQTVRQETVKSIYTDVVNATKTPDATAPLSRSEFVEMFMDHLYGGRTYSNCFELLVYAGHPGYTLLFADVSVQEDYALHLCMAMNVGLVNGYRDGWFRPDDTITFADAAKLIGRAYAFTPYPFGPQPVWYTPYMDEFARRNLIPTNVKDASSTLTEADLHELFQRLDGTYVSTETKAFTKRVDQKPLRIRN